MKRFLFFLIAFAASIGSLCAQSKTITGKVMDEFYELMPGVMIMIHDTVVVGKIDMDGTFQIDIPVSEKKIMFSGIGLETTKIELVDGCDKVEVVMMAAFFHDFVTPRQVDRDRKKRFNKLPEIHKQAFKDGIFATESACYKREFVYSFSEQDRRISKREMKREMKKNAAQFHRKAQ